MRVAKISPRLTMFNGDTLTKMNNQNNIKVIGVCGYLRSGKDSFFTILNKLYPDVFKRFAFADTLKWELHQFAIENFNIDVFYCSDKDKSIIRPLMIGLGEAHRNQNPNHWIEALAKSLESNNKIAVLTDCRYENEILFFKNIYGDAFKLVEIERVDSGITPPAEELRNHPKVQKYIDYKINWVTVGDNDLSRLEPYVIECYNHLFKK